MKGIFANNKQIKFAHNTKDNLTDLVEIVTQPTESTITPIESIPTNENTPQQQLQSSSDNQVVQGNDGEPVTLNIRFID